MTKEMKTDHIQRGMARELEKMDKETLEDEKKIIEMFGECTIKVLTEKMNFSPFLAKHLIDSIDKIKKEKLQTN